MKRWANPMSNAVPDEPDMTLNEGVVSDRVLNAYKKASARLTELGIPHLVVGGLAVGAWGHPRATKDVDFLVREHDAFNVSSILTFKHDVPIEVDGVDIDYLTVESLRIRGRKEIIHGTVVPIEILFAMKLRARRMQDDADLVALIKAGADIRTILDWLQDHALAAEHKRLIQLIKIARAESAR